MSKSKRESNYRKEERRYSDGGTKYDDYYEHKHEKRLKNAFRSNDVSSLMNEDLQVKYRR